MKNSFAENAYPTKAILRMLVEQLGLNESKVARWFSSERRRVRSGKHMDVYSIA